MQDGKTPEYHLIGTIQKGDAWFARIADANAVGGMPAIEELRRELRKAKEASAAFNRAVMGTASPRVDQSVMRIRGGVHDYTRAQCAENEERMRAQSLTGNEEAFRLGQMRIDAQINGQAPQPAVAQAPRQRTI